MDIVTFKLTGLAELQEKLDTMPLKASRKIMRTSLREAAAIWLTKMKQLVRRGPHHFGGKKGTVFGVIERALTMRAVVKSDLEASVAVGVPEKIFWAKFVEFGTRARRRGSIAGYAMSASPITGKKTRLTLHKGAGTGTMPSFPFVRPTFDSTREEVLAKFVEDVKQQLRDAGLPVS